MNTNGIMIENFNLLKEKITGNFGNCINLASEYGMIQHNHFLEVSFDTERQMMFDDLIDLLEDRLKMHVLYAQRTRDGRNVNVVMFSQPATDKMYIIYLNSGLYGVIDRLHFAFYDSMENMYLILLKHLLQFEGRKRNSSSSNEIIELEKTDRKKLYSIFN